MYSAQPLVAQVLATTSLNDIVPGEDGRRRRCRGTRLTTRCRAVHDAAQRAPRDPLSEEIVANIVSHGAAGGRKVDVHFTLEPRPDSMILTFEDDGVAFDPRGIARRRSSAQHCQADPRGIRKPGDIGEPSSPAATGVRGNSCRVWPP